MTPEGVILSSKDKANARLADVGMAGHGVHLWHLLGQRVAVCQRHRPLRRLSNCSPEII